MSSSLVPGEEAPLVAPNTAPAVASTVATVVGRVLIVTTVLVIATILVVSTVLTIVSAILTVVTITTDGKVNSVIDRSTLGNWHENSLMVRSGGDGGYPVCTSREALGDISSELAVGGSCIETLEEGEDTWVCGLRGVERWDLFNDDVVVSNNLSGVVQLLRCSVVSVGGVSESTGLHSLRIHDNGEGSVGLNITTIGRELELYGWHVVNTGNITHRRRIA